MEYTETVANHNLDFELSFTAELDGEGSYIEFVEIQKVFNSDGDDISDENFISFLNRSKEIMNDFTNILDKEFSDSITEELKEIAQDLDDSYKYDID